MEKQLIALLILLNLAYIVQTDIRFRLIPNRAILPLLFASLFLSISKGQYETLLYGIAFLIVGVIFLVWFFAPGDIKLASVLVSLILPDYYLLTLVLTLFLGGVLALSYLLIKGKKFTRERGLPYGVPICISGYLGILASL